MNLSALRTALCNGLGFGFVVAAAIYVDSNIHHIVFGIREYPFGYKTVFLSIIVTIATYFINILNINYYRKAICTFFCFMLPIVFLLLTIFLRPVFPHPSVLGVSLVYSTIIALTVLINEYKISDDFLDFKTISERVKLEKVKIEYDFWFKLFMTSLSGFSLWALYYSYYFSQRYLSFTNIKIEQILLESVFNMAFVLSLILFSLLCLEIVKKIFIIKNMLLRVTKSISDHPENIPARPAR